MRILFAGTPEVGLPVAKFLAPELVGVLTRPDAQVGRGRELKPSPIAQWAQESSIETFKTSQSTPELIDWLTEKEPDIGVVVAFGALLPSEVLSIPRHGWLNIHFSLLPHLRGAAPVQRAILNGDEITGVTIFQLDEGMDTGPIFGSVTREIGERERSDDLLRALTLQSIPLLGDVLKGISEGSLRSHPQELQGVSYAPKVSKEEYRILWDRPAHAIVRQVRAFHPLAFASFRGERIAVLEAVKSDIHTELSLGELLVEANKLFIGCAFGSVEICRVRPAGKSEMSVADWLRGARTSPGERFE